MITGILFFLNVLITLGVVLWLVYAIYDLCKCRFGQYPTFASSFSETKKKLLEEAAGYLNQARTKQNVVDLGCGNGALLVPLAKRFPHHEFYGYDWNTVAYVWAKWRTRRFKNVHIYRQDFMKVDLSEMNMAFCFLIKALIPRISKKIQKEMPAGALIFSELFPLEVNALKHKVEAKTFGFGLPYYVYEVKKSKR